MIIPPRNLFHPPGCHGHLFEVPCWQRSPRRPPAAQKNDGSRRRGTRQSVRQPPDAAVADPSSAPPPAGGDFTGLHRSQILPRRARTPPPPSFDRPLPLSQQGEGGQDVSLAPP